MKVKMWVEAVEWVEEIPDAELAGRSSAQRDQLIGLYYNEGLKGRESGGWQVLDEAPGADAIRARIDELEAEAARLRGELVR